MSANSGPDDQTTQTKGLRLSRRAAIGGAAWSVPVVAVATAAPAFAAGSMFTLTRTSPAGNFSADAAATTQSLSVTLTDGTGNPVSGRNILLTVSGDTSTDWLSFAPSAAATNSSGLASTTLQYGRPKPPAGSSFTVLATLQNDTGVMTSWTLTYAPAVGNVTVSRVGAGAVALSSAATAVFLDTFNPAGGAVGTPLALPTTGGASPQSNPLTLSGTATSEGQLIRSADGSILTLGGYGATTNPATATVASTASSSTPRVVGRITASGGIDTTTAATDALSGNNIRGAAAVDSGADTWISGAIEGIRYVAQGATTSTVVSSNVTNTRVDQVIGGQLYFTSASGTGAGTAGIYQVGSGLPKAAGNTSTLAIATGGSPYGFVLLNRSASVTGLDTAYVADDTSSVGIRKFSLVNGIWTANGIFASAGGCRGLAGTVDPDGNVVLFATTSTTTSANTLVKIVDTSKYNETIAATSSVIATAAANTVFRGVAFAPSA